MRLVCDKCSALYTIEDGLVGTRDFRVSCKSCGEPIYVKSARQVTFGATHRVRLPGSALPRVSVLATVAARGETRSKSAPAAPPASAGDETWFVTIDGKQRGPLGIVEVASLFEKGSLDWSHEVWREGLKGWRPARRDALLVTAVAGARGAVNDTTRLDAARSFLAPEDTVVEPRFGHTRARMRGARSTRKDSADATEKHVLETRAQPAPAAKPEALPDLRPSARPQAWHSPENEAFREALGLPTDSSQQASQAQEESPAPAAQQAPLADAPVANQPGPTLADAFVSATTLLDEQRRNRLHAQPQTFWELLPERVVERVHGFYQEHVNSHYLVALSSFAAGVLVTAMVLGRPLAHTPATAQVQLEPRAVEAQREPTPASPQPALAEPARPAAPAGVASSAMLPVATVQSVQSTVAGTLAEPPPPPRELPTVEDLRREVRKVAPDVRRCVEDPNTGVDVDIYLSGITGHVRDVDVRSPLIPPGRQACIINAVRRMELSPFTRSELKLMHKFSW